MRIVHFLNQFFAGLGGEEMANTPVQVLDGAVGPGRALQLAVGSGHEVVATIAVGDNYFSEENALAGAAVREALGRLEPDAVIAGPALNAGRYGLACGHVCAIAKELDIPAVTGMYSENPGVLEWGKQVYIVPTGEAPTGLAQDLKSMADLALKMASGQEIGPAEEEGYLPRGIRRPGVRDKRGSLRATEMLAARLHDRPFKTELPVVVPDRVEPALFIGELRNATVGLVTTGGLVPKGNPDKMVRGGSEMHFAYSIEGLNTMSPDAWECVHRGFFTDITNENPNYILPLNVIRRMEKRGAIGRVHNTFLSVAGVGTAVTDSQRIGREMAGELKAAGVDICVMVAT
jgi:glycine reductase